jgi:flagellar motility protein MotE (MotC chaperone)
MKKYVLPVLIWMIILKVGVVAVYLAGNRPGVLVGDRNVPEQVTAPVSLEPGLPAGQLAAPVQQVSLPALSLMSSANAADTAHAADTANALETGEQAGEPVVENTATQEQMTAQLVAERETLLEKEKYLERQEARLKELKEEITRKIEELTLLREEILATMELKNEIQEAEVKHLIKIYSTMKPQKVAQLIEQLDIDLVTALFSRMKGDVVGDILSFVDSETGARITQGLFPEQTGENAMP